jgi:Ca2+-binding EF-hand superfamily protein
MNIKGIALIAALVLAPIIGLAPAAEQKKQKPQPVMADDVQDLVFLGEARPVYLRLHVRVDGKSVGAAWDAFVKQLFKHLDVNGDGFLSKDEAEGVPTVDQILSGLPVSGLGALGGFGGAPSHPSFDDLDADKDGKVSLAELSTFYRKQGFLPVQFQHDTKEPNPIMMAIGGGGGEPTVGAISDSIFKLLDTNKDGKLSREELAAAADVLLKLDENDDEMIVPRELVPPAEPKVGGGGFTMPNFGGGKKVATDNYWVTLLEYPGQAPALLMERMKVRYAKEKGKSLTREDLGLDEATFAKLDTNGDGVLDDKELAGWFKRTPDVELTLRIGGRTGDQGRVEPAGKAAPLAKQLQTTSNYALLDLGATRIELRGNEAQRPDRLGGIIRQQFQAQFRQADKDGNGYIDAKEAEASPFFRGLFKTLDRDGDGKVTEKEFLAYLDGLRDLQKRGQAACVTVVLTDQSRGLFDLLDVNRDGRLSVREMRGAVKLLDVLNLKEKGFITKGDLPKSYLLTLRRGGATRGDLDFLSALEDAYGGSYEDASYEDYATAGPMWFRKMDKNRDGDVSRKEFLGTDEQFRQIDTDGDGLISAEEAERYDALMRKKK